MEAITVKELLAAVHGELLQGEGTAKILGVNTDSRTVKAGEVFLPLVGERFDGHDYIEKALSAGAEGCLCARVPETLLPGKFYIKVPDTLLALKGLGRVVPCAVFYPLCAGDGQRRQDDNKGNDRLGTGREVPYAQDRGQL